MDSRPSPGLTGQPSPASSLPQTRLSLRSSLSSVFKGPSMDSRTPHLGMSPTQRPEARFRMSLGVRGTRSGPPNTLRSQRVMRSRSSTRSLIDASILPVSNIVQPLNITPRVCRGGTRAPSPSPVLTHTAPTSQRVLSGASLQDLVLQQDARRVRQQEGHGRRNKRSRIFQGDSFRQPKVRAKAVMAVVFGCTLVVALAVYLGLAVAGIGSGPMYHTLFILLILALTAVFCHSLLRMFMCILHPPTRARSHRRDGTTDYASTDGILPEKPIPIIMAIDEDEEAQIRLAAVNDVPIVEKIVIRPPPPVYGEYRSSTRMNPSLVHWQKQDPLPPSPLTPTYDEAMTEVHKVLGIGYRPPSYVSEGGVVVVGSGTGQMGMGDLHPLERERVQALIGVAV